jgi:hypothetical protein
MKKEYIKPTTERTIIGATFVVCASIPMGDTITQASVTTGDAKIWGIEDELRAAIEEELRLIDFEEEDAI